MYYAIRFIYCKLEILFIVEGKNAPDVVYFFFDQNGLFGCDFSLKKPKNPFKSNRKT